MEPFSKRVKELRIQKQMRQEDLAQVIEVTKGTVSKWECGARIPDYATIQKLSAILDAVPAYILGSIDNRHGNSDEKSEPAKWEIDADEQILYDIITKLVCLSRKSRSIIAGAVNAAYTEDQNYNTLLTQNEVFEVKISPPRSADAVENNGE